MGLCSRVQGDGLEDNLVKKLLLVLAFLLVPGVALACPQVNLNGVELRYSGGELWDAKYFDVVAGGTENLERCNIRTGTGERAVGWVAPAPDFELYFTGGNYSLEFRVVGAPGCDTVLLINTANENWYFDDDDFGDGDAKIRLTRPSEGWYDIWIGTYDPGNCNSRLTIETF